MADVRAVPLSVPSRDGPLEILFVVIKILKRRQRRNLTETVDIIAVADLV